MSELKPIVLKRIYKVRLINTDGKSIPITPPPVMKCVNLSAPLFALTIIRGTGPHVPGKISSNSKYKNINKIVLLR
jgi:hypothetical protein